MNLDGHLYNPDFAGEGFQCNTVGAKVYGNFYSYTDNGKPEWLQFVCDILGDTATGRVTRYSGGAMGSPGNPQNVEDEDVGSITFVHDEGWSVDARIGGRHIAYPLTNLIPSEPPSDNPFDGVLSFRVKGWSAPQFYPGEFTKQNGQWFAVWSTAQIGHSRLSAGRNTVLEIEITAHQDLPLTFGASGYGSPAWDARPGFIAAGDTVTLSCELTKSLQPTGHENANYQLDTPFGTLVLFTARILQGT